MLCMGGAQRNRTGHDRCHAQDVRRGRVQLRRVLPWRVPDALAADQAGPTAPRSPRSSRRGADLRGMRGTVVRPARTEDHTQDLQRRMPSQSWPTSPYGSGPLGSRCRGGRLGSSGPTVPGHRRALRAERATRWSDRSASRSPTSTQDPYMRKGHNSTKQLWPLWHGGLAASHWRGARRRRQRSGACMGSASAPRSRPRS